MSPPVWVCALAEHFYEQTHKESPKLGEQSMALLESAGLAGNLDQLRIWRMMAKPLPALPEDLWVRINFADFLARNFRD